MKLNRKERREKRKIQRYKRENSIFGRIFRHNNLMFTFYRSFFSTLLFIPIFFLYIGKLPRLPLFSEESWTSFGIITLIVIGIRLISFGISYWITRHTNMEANAQYFLRALFITALTSIVIFIEIFAFLERNFGMWYGILIFCVIQFSIFYLADYVSDNILFQH